MIWRSAIVSGYIALAILIGVAYGGHGLLVLFYYYFWAGAWVVFLLAWGWATRAAGRWNYRRVESVPSGRARNGSPPRAGEAAAAEHDKVGVEPNPVPAADAAPHQPVPVYLTVQVRIVRFSLRWCNT